MYAFLAAILLLSCGVNMCQAMDATKFANTLKDFATNGMGVDALQAHYDGLSYTTKDVDGAALISDLSSDIGETFSILTAAATNIKLAVEENYASFESDLSSGMTSCCDVRGESNLKFQSNISFTAPCWTVSPKSPVEKKFPNAAVGSVMESNYEANSNKLLWQYFGSENGTSILYPQAKVSTTSCESFDPRFRPYYATAATPMAKDIVVLVDTSPSMHNTDNTGRTRLKLAKEVATTTLQTLNPNDRFAVVTFDPNSYKPTSGCYADQLSLYTPDNERFLSKFIGHIDVTGNSDINVGLEAAFHYFQNSSAPTEDDERSQVILVLSDGADFPSTRSPLDVIRDENAKLRNRVVIMVYGLGNDLVPGTSAELMLRNISVQSRNNPAAGTTKPGFYENIDIAEAVRSKMGSYYSFFKSSSTTAVVSDPFIDTFSSIGLLISVCLPAYDKTDLDILLGVACADVKLSDLFSKAAVFNEGDLSYVFIIDSKGRTLSHPLLPLSRTVKTSYTQLDISYLERSEEAAPVIEAMKRKESGNQVVHSSTRTMARGVVLNEGIITRKVKSTYYYAPIPNSDYSVCVVVGDGAKDAKFPAQTRREGVFVYHRRDIYNDNLPSCRNFQRKATIAHSIVQFNDNAFKDIGTFLYEKENANIVDRYTKYFNGETTSETRFRDEVAKSVVVSFKAEEIWKSKSDLSLYTIWRYFGTKDGYIRVFPGVQLPDYYTHETRSWWRRSKSQRGILTMTTPYVDAWGAGLMVTFSRAIYVGRQNGAHTDLDDVEGVLGYDVSLSYLHRVVYADNPECQRADNICMLVDNSGFIIIHPDFVDPNIRESERRALVEDIHLVQKESDIAAHLIARSVMSRQSCANFDNHKLQMTYRVQLNDGENHISGPNYDMWEVEGTSVYLVRKTVTDVPVQCCTNIPMISPASKTCSDSVFCDCLCHISIAFDTCLNINNKDGISQTCIAKTPDTEYTTDPDVTTGLQDCYNPACETETTEGDCYSYTGCSWCVRDDNAPLSKPCCRGVDTCDFGKVLGGSQHVCPDTTQRPVTSTQETTAPKNSSQVDTAVIVGAVLGSVVVILCIVIILICYRRHVCHPRSNPADDYLTAVPTVRDNTAGVVNQQYAGMQTGSPPPYNSYSDTKDTNFIPMHHNATTTNNYHTMPGSSNSSGSSGSVPSHSQASQQQHLPPNTLPTDKRL